MRPAHLLCGALAGMILWAAGSAALAKSEGPITQGRLDAIGSGSKPLGSCPLKHTDVTVDISGFIARVTVRQQFHNPFPEKIEAIYVFPLSQDAAVDRMTMKVGDRIIQGEIKERGEARAIYESAKAAGKVASLLDQERPNIFTQSVANIEAGEQVDISISYSETLDWKDGEYQFDFPMVVGPRYIPGGGSAPAPMATGQPTAEVPDADRVTPPVTPEGTRAGHDISLTVNLNAGLPLRRIDSKQHAVTVDYPKADKTQAVIKLKQQETIPNKDFVLVYETSSDKIEDALLAHTDQRGKFFTLVLQPPKRVRTELIVPKEIVFVIDKSGSMSGFPIETAKQAMRLCIEGLHENDTFNLMTFEGGVGFCFDRPVPNTDANRQKALQYLASLQGSGGTEMMKAIHACLAGQDDPERVRVVCFMTDGYVGNDMAIIDAVKRNAGIARVFSFGIGTSVNRFLLDGIARAGRGEVHYILDERQAAGAAERFYERVRTPVLTDIELDFGGLAVEELYPARVPDLFSSTPVVVKGQYKQGGRGTITLRGKTGEGKFERKIDVTLPEEEPNNEVLASLWARAKVDDLMQQDLAGVQRGTPNPAMKEEILGLGLRYQLLTQFTSFVAVEHLRITEGNTVRTVPVPVEMPEGVSYEGVFGPGGRPMAVGMGMGGMGGMAFRGAGQRLAAIRPAAGAPARATLMRRYGGTMVPAETAGRESLRQSQADALTKQLEGMDKQGKSDDEKKPVVEQLLKIKLAPELQGLAQKVAQQGRDGNLTIGKIQVKAGRVEIRLQLTALSDELLAKLKKLGFKELARAKSVNLLIGTIDVKQLEALAKLAEVRRIDPSS
jgi:Ca-activated chloride channel family protein